MDLGIADKVAVLTGASGGLGESIALALAAGERHRDRRREHVAAEFVDDHLREEVRLAVLAPGQIRHPAFALDHVVEGRPVTVGPVAAIPRAEPVDDARIARRDRRVVDSQPLCGFRAHAVKEHVGAVHQTHQHIQ